MMRFTVLASGSSGNSSLLEFNGFNVLIDIGLGPRILAARLAAIGSSWQKVNAAILTHTHGDHWKERSLAQLRQLGIPLYCHAGHRDLLQECSSSFRTLKSNGLVRDYASGTDLSLAENLRCRPLDLSHDSDPTFGFRIEGNGGLFGTKWSLGYLSDLGCWNSNLVEAVEGVDVLALEFNHDEALERQSRRPFHLIDRVLSDMGHLSNDQASDFVRTLLERGSRPSDLVQLHLSRECNRPELAAAAARSIMSSNSSATRVYTASQHRVGPTIDLDPGQRPKRSVSRRIALESQVVQPSLPGME